MDEIYLTLNPINPNPNTDRRGNFSEKDVTRILSALSTILSRPGVSIVVYIRINLYKIS